MLTHVLQFDHKEMSKKKKANLLDWTENIIYLIIWALLFSIPFYGAYRNGMKEIDWYFVGRFWLKLTPVMVAFAIHNYVLLPHLLFRKRAKSYIAYIIGLIALLVAVNIYDNAMLRLKQADRMPFRPIPQKQIGPKKYREERTLSFRERNGVQPSHLLRSNPHNPPFIYIPFLPLPMILSPIVITIFIIGLNMGIKSIIKSIRDDQRLKELKTQNLQTELDYLKYQINPHFFMNTLNNIHALVDIDPEKAKGTVLELSKMMRYVLYESNKRTVTLWDEIDFLQHYIELMKLRYTDRLELIISIHKEELPPAQVPPLLLITFVENAFKHGVSYQEPSFIHITMDVFEGRLRYLVVNSSHQAPTGELHGIGLENVRKRLQLIYNQQYTLDIQQRATEYQVLLLIPLQL